MKVQDTVPARGLGVHFCYSPGAVTGSAPSPRGSPPGCLGHHSSASTGSPKHSFFDLTVREEQQPGGHTPSALLGFKPTPSDAWLARVEAASYGANSTQHAGHFGQR